MALSEKELVTKIEIILQKVFNTELSFREISAGYGIADLVLAPSGSRSTSSQRAPITHFGMLKFFLSLRKNVYAYDELVAAAPYIPQQDIRRYINFLLSHGYLVRSDTTYKRALIMEDHPIKTIIAVEAKLTDYRNGILQAKRYQYFADQSYLAILKRASKHIDVKKLTDSGIGLILFDEATEDIEIVEPSQRITIQEKTYNLFAKEVLLSRMATFSS